MEELLKTQTGYSSILKKSNKYIATEVLLTIMSKIRERKYGGKDKIYKLVIQKAQYQINWSYKKSRKNGEEKNLFKKKIS